MELRNEFAGPSHCDDGADGGEGEGGLKQRTTIDHGDSLDGWGFYEQ